MALRSLTLPFIFAFLLFSQVIALDLEEKSDNKDANVAGAGDAKFPYGYGHRPRCRYFCHGRCCSAEEFAAFSQAVDQVDAKDFSDDKNKPDFYGPRPRFPPRYGPGHRFPPRRPPFCRPYCGSRCCTAEEYAEFVKAGN